MFEKLKDVLYFIVHFGKKREWFNDKAMLERRVELTKGQMIDNSISHEIAWIMTREMEVNIELMKEQIEKNLESIKEIEAKPDRTEEISKKLQELRDVNKGLGHTGKLDKNNEPMYAGLIIESDNKIGQHIGEIKKMVEKREYFERQLIALEVLIDRCNKGKIAFGSSITRGKVSTDLSKE